MNLNGVYGVCEIIHDPDPLGGFAAGARLQGVFPMLKDGVLTPGTELRMMGHRYLVLGATGKPQHLIVRR